MDASHTLTEARDRASHAEGPARRAGVAAAG